MALNDKLRKRLEGLEEKFWEFLVNNHGEFMQVDHTKEALVLMTVIDSAFADHPDVKDEFVPTHHRLTQYLAGYTQELLEYGPQQKGDVVGPSSKTNHFLSRAYKGLFQTICHAIKEDKIKDYGKGEILFGCLEIPRWLFTPYKDWFEAEANRIKEFRNEFANS